MSRLFRAGDSPPLWSVAKFDEKPEIKTGDEERGEPKDFAGIPWKSEGEFEAVPGFGDKAAHGGVLTRDMAGVCLCLRYVKVSSGGGAALLFQPVGKSGGIFDGDLGGGGIGDLIVGLIDFLGDVGVIGENIGGNFFD